ncbi:MAG: helix-turn-helix domain-containing protein [Ruminococcus sp.]|nr:helix-turn-helix domain-containing protein [Ruminococcus sp.]
MPKRKVSSVVPMFGRRLKQYRVACGLTQEQVASVLNLNRTTYIKYETGASEPSYEILCRIVSLLGTDFNSVLEESDKFEGSIFDTKMPLFNLTKGEQEIIIAFRSFSDEEKAVLNDKITEILIDRNKKLTERKGVNFYVRKQSG